jgi:hypothetical protein
MFGTIRQPSGLAGASLARFIFILPTLLLCAAAPKASHVDTIEKLLFEIHNYTAGEFNDFTIGMSKQRVLDHIHPINAEAHITPIPFREFVISSKNLGELRSTNDLQGLRLFNYKGF